MRIMSRESSNMVYYRAAKKREESGALTGWTACSCF